MGNQYGLRAKNALKMLQAKRDEGELPSDVGGILAIALENVIADTAKKKTPREIDLRVLLRVEAFLDQKVNYRFFEYMPTKPGKQLRKKG